MLWGAIIGDIVGSIYEFNNIKTKDFPFLDGHGFITDDSVMTIAVAQALLNSKINKSDLQTETIKSMQELGRRYPNSGYGFRFARWLQAENPEPVDSWGNGAAMRVSACGYVGTTLSDVKRLSYLVTSVSHDHIEGIKGAEATAVAVFMARMGATKDEISRHIIKDYYDLCFDVDYLQQNYGWDGSCQGTVPQALECFIESESYEDAIRNAISIGGDSDTIGAITGAVAEAYYGVPDWMRDAARKYIPDDLYEIMMRFENEIYA
ncbi:MAG: ADP-ribosylglycohydrolase family protein [Rickettsiales bacterium]|jgi:type I restriction enzyme M protein|nr:ADP-ribosylglycohydrolase family protein [Rickettsiales bacterium]